MASTHRFPLAGFLLAIPAAFAAWITFLYAWTFLTQGPLRATGMTVYALMGGVLFGLPLIAAVILLVALPIAMLLRRTVGISLPAAVLSGAMCGLLVRVLVELWLGQPEVRFVPWAVVLLTGAVTGWVWWRVR